MDTLHTTAQPLPVWTPPAGQTTQLDHFRTYLSERYGVSTGDFDDVYAWSVAYPDTFWEAAWHFFGIKASAQPTRICQPADHMMDTRWFVGARLNFAENLLARRDETIAITFSGEGRVSSQWRWQDLYAMVSRLSQALRQAGIRPGDRVAGIVPNMPETIAAMLATAAVGAIWSSCSPDFGVQGLLDRLGQIEPKLVFGADSYYYNGKFCPVTDKITAVACQLPGQPTVVLWPYDAQRGLETGASFSALDDFVAPFAVTDIAFEQLPFDAPLYILYSSGTTGKPKCIVHGAGGTLLQHLKEHRLHGNLGEHDRLCYFTTCGWMMWNWMVSALATGTTLVLYDGSPLLPNEPDILWRLVSEQQVTHFGTSAKYLSAIEKQGLQPGQRWPLTALTTVYSTGSPLLPESYDYVYRHIKPDLTLSSISGGTDIVSCFALGSANRPVYKGELQVRGLGLSVEVWNDAGQPMVGEKGELVCTRPFPNMPLGFWNDPDRSKYFQAYFNRFPNIWTHGDYAELTPRGGLIIYGRSDTVLNPGGVRIGTAEIYRQVETVPEVLESVCIGQAWHDDERIILFVRLRDGLTLDDSLITRIKQRIRQETTPRHVPAKIIQVHDIPRTLSGKIVEGAVKAVVHAQEVKNTEALANPEALACFRHIAALSMA